MSRHPTEATPEAPEDDEPSASVETRLPEATAAATDAAFDDDCGDSKGGGTSRK